MGGCAVLECKNRVEKGGKHFYRFPRDPEKRKTWAVFTKRGLNWEAKDSNTICEAHFAENCFVSKQKRLFLTKEAIPTIYFKETETGTEKYEIPYDGNFDSYCALIKQEEDIEIELDSTKKLSRLEEIKVLCRFCGVEKEDLIDMKHFESYNIDISLLFGMLELNTEPACNNYLSVLCCEECFNQIVLLDTFKIKCKTAEQKILAELEVLVPELKLSNSFQSYPILEIVGSVKDQYLNISDQTVYEEAGESVDEPEEPEVPTMPLKVESMDVYENPTDPEEVIKNPKRNKFVLKVYECLFCKSKFGGKKTFKSHACKIKEIRCEECDKVFDRPQAYKSHKAHSHGLNQLEKHYCPMCKSVILGNISRFQQHRKKCNKERTKPIECEICHKLLNSLNGYTIHKMFHDSVKHNGESLLKSEKPVGDTVCELCGKTFRTTSGYRTHKLTAHMESNEVFQCDVENCMKICSNKLALSDHKRNSHKVQESPCNVCFKVFRTKVLLRKHMIYHDETKRIFKCKFCPDKPGYFTNVALKRHQKMHFGQEKSHSCELCDLSYSSSQQLKQHLLSKHEILETTEIPASENDVQYQIEEVQQIDPSQTILTITQIY